MKYSSERIYVRFWKVEDAPLLLDLQVRNRESIERTSASNRDDSYYSLERQRGGFTACGSQPVPIQGTLKEHTMFAVDIQ